MASQSRKDRLKKAFEKHTGPKDLEDSETGMHKKAYESKEDSDTDKAAKIRKKILEQMKKEK